MPALPSFHRHSHRRPLTILLILSLATMLLGPIADQMAMAQADNQQEQPDEAQQPEDPVATEEAALPTEEPVVVTEEAVASEEVAATEIPTEAAAPESVTLTITVYRCDHPEFDTGFSENIQRVINECTGPGSGTFTVLSTTEETRTGGSLSFEILGGLAIVETLQPGYDNPIANCFVYDANGNLADQIGPGETSGGGWKVGSIGNGDVHCDWYQVDRGLGAVYVVNMACPSTAGLFPAPSMTDLVAICTEPAGQKQFFVVHGAGLERMVPSGGEFNDALFEAIQTGPIEIWMDDPAGFDKARVFCQVTTLEGAEISPFAEVSVGTFRATGMTLVAGQRIHCSWFNIQEGPGIAQPDVPEATFVNEGEAPTPTPAPAELRIVKHTCQPNFDLDTDDPMADCPEGPNGVTFTLAADDAADDAQQSTTGDSVPNTVVFAGIPGGDYTITETVPPNVGTVFVLGCGGGGGIDPIPQVIDGTLETSIPQGVILTCHWFNIRGGQNVIEREGTPQALDTGTGRVVIQNYVCPDAPIDPSLGIEAMVDACGDRIEGIPMTAAGQDGYTGAETSSTTGTVIFEDVPVGEVTIAAGDVAGYGEPAVFCNTLPADQRAFMQPTEQSAPPPDQEPPFEGIAVSQRTIAYTVQAGHEVACAWFNIPSGALVEASPEADAPGTGSITIAKYNCPAGFDVNTVDANPQGSCTPTEGINFDIDDSADDNAGYFIETGATGMGTVDQLPADTYYIDEGVRNGTTSTFVWDCYDAAGSSARTDPLKLGSTLSYDLADGETVRCDFYNVIGGTSRVVINKHACDYLVPAYTLTLEQLQAQCTIDTGTINFTVVSDFHQETQPASNNPLMLASFANVPSGNIAVGEENIARWANAIVYCGIYDENGTVVTPVAQTDVIQDRSIYLNLEPGQVASCDWYNVAQGFVDVTVTKHACPEGFDAYGADLAMLVTGCTDDPGSVEIIVEDGVTYQSKQATAAAPASFLDVQSGELRIGEKLPDGYGIPVVWCRVDFEDGSNVTPAQPVTITNGSNQGELSFYHDASADQVLVCEWFNVKGGAGMVSVWKQACPEGFDIHGATRLELEIGCTEDFGEVEFSVTTGSFTATDTSTYLSPYADFYAVPAGPVTVRETSVTEYDTAIVYCRVQGDEGVTPEELVELGPDRSISWDLGPDEWLICEWYNAYEQGNVIDVTKYTCPEGTGYEEELSFYLESCTAPAKDGIEFTLTSSDGIGVGYTAGGKVIFENVAVGPVSIQERIPEEYGEPVVFCEFVPYNTPMAEPAANRVEAPNGTVSLVFDGLGQRFACYWFNIPDEGSTIVIHKFTCPESSPHDEDAGWYAENCTEPLEGVEFTLTAGMGASTLSTGANGEVEWTGLPLGSFSIQETIPYEYGQPVVFCGIVSSSGGEIDAVAEPVEAPNGYHSGEIAYPQTLYVCYWFNMIDGPGEITIHKYTCPEGYDLDAWNADPQEDCTQPASGIGFSVTGEGSEVGAETGVDGAVTFGQVEPGSYTVTESVPEGTAYVFVLDCYGQDRGSLRPYPLSMGETLEIQVGAGEAINCYWYNVPEYEQGRITVLKYTCTTKTYVSNVDCEIEEDGVTFDLVVWDGDSWEYADTQTTDGGGMIGWDGVDPGQYWLDEHDAEWCHIASAQISDDGNWINVTDGQETVIEVYNCGGTPGTPGKTPMKYPNTGVPPVDDLRRHDLP